jgi:hypothetical protein
MKGTTVLIKESCIEQLGRLFEGNKEGHYVKDVRHVITKDVSPQLVLKFIALTKVATFHQGNILFHELWF